MSRKLNILHLVISLETGGLERFVLDLIEANAPHSNQVIVCLEGPGTLAKNCSAEIVALHMPPGMHLSFAWQISKIVQERQVDLIHTHNEKAQFYGGIAGWLAKVPILHTKHGRNNLDWRTVLRNNISSRFCTNIVAVSHDAARECTDDEKIPVNKVTTILNGVDTVRYSPGVDQQAAKARLGIDSQTLVVGIVARLAPVKDHATLLKACKILVESGCQFRLLVVGDGPLRQQLHEFVDVLGIGEQVIFTGMREDIPDLMQAMDVFVLSSVSEGISLTLLEAMACCLPVVATAVGGNPEVVVEGTTGFLAKSGSPEDIAAKLTQVLSTKELRKSMGAAGRSRVLEKFSLNTSAQAYLNLYRTIVRNV